MAGAGRLRGRVPAKGWVLVGFSLAVGLALPAVFRSITRAPDHGTYRQDDSVRPGIELPDGSPIVGGERVSLEEAERLVEYEVLRPQDPLASDETLTAVWAAEENGHLAFEYESGVLVMLFPIDPNAQRTNYEEDAKQFENMYVTTIQGNSALVALGNIPGRAPAILVGIGNLEVQIQGRFSGILEADILRLADSVVSSKT